MKALLLLLVVAPAHADTVGHIINIHDGDTVALDSGVRVRLYGIDAPELAQPYGPEAREALVALVSGRDVHVIEHDIDRYGRLVGEVMAGAIDANRALIAAGAAWCYVRYLPPDSDCPALEAQARAARHGLWANPNAIAPWVWRKHQREPKP